LLFFCQTLGLRLPTATANFALAALLAVAVGGLHKLPSAMSFIYLPLEQITLEVVV
jgi:hypothetical protein